MTNTTRLAFLLGLQLAAGAALIGCGSDSEPEENESSEGGGSEVGKGDPIQLTYAPMYSAFVPGHEAQLPVTLKDTALRGKGAKFTSSDTSVATVIDNDEGGLITVKKDGTTTIKATFEGRTGSAKLTVKAYTEAQWTAGQMRYSKSDLAIVPAPGDPVNLLSLANPAAKRNANGACNTCHTAQAQTLKIENTPTQIAGYSDDELITIFTMGKKPETGTMQSRIPAFAWGMFHSWEVTEEEKQGLIAFLRTQTPKPNPAMIDYGVQLCAGAPTPTAGQTPMLCDNNGKPVAIPGLPGAGGGSTTPAADAGVAAAGDAG